MEISLIGKALNFGFKDYEFESHISNLNWKHLPFIIYVSLLSLVLLYLLFNPDLILNYTVVSVYLPLTYAIVGFFLWFFGF